MTACIICGSPAEVSVSSVPVHSPVFDCQRCGVFQPISTAVDALRSAVNNGPIDRSALSHRLRRSYENSQKANQIVESDLLGFADLSLPKPQAQADNLILWLGAQQKHPEDWVTVTKQRLAAIVGTAVSLPQVAEQGLQWIMNEIEPRRLFNLQGADAVGFRVRLAMTGWQVYEALVREKGVGMTAFMAMSFRAGEIEQVEPVFRNCFRPAAKRAGFDLRVVTDGQTAGLIDDQIRVAIRRSRFVVADLTHDNNGAYFEAGFAEGLGLEVIYTCEKSKFDAKSTHFDTNHRNTIVWSPATLGETGSRLTAMIRNSLPDIAKMDD